MLLLDGKVEVEKEVMKFNRGEWFSLKTACGNMLNLYVSFEAYDVALHHTKYSWIVGTPRLVQALTRFTVAG